MPCASDIGATARDAAVGLSAAVALCGSSMKAAAATAATRAVNLLNLVVRMSC